MLLLPNVKQVFLKCFYNDTINMFHDSLNAVAILAPSREFFSTK